MEENNRQDENRVNQDQNIQIDRPSRDNRAPEYSFWAEQITPGQNYSNYSYQQNPNSWNYNNTMPDQGMQPVPSADTGKKKEKNKALRFIFRAACFGLLAGLSFVIVQYLYGWANPGSSNGGNKYILGTAEDNNKQDTSLKVETTGTGSVKTAPASAVSEMIERTMPSIVTITSSSTRTDSFFGQAYPVEGSGSGIIVGKNDKELLIATNNHVVAGANEISVTFIDGKSGAAVIKGTDASADLAVITVDITNLEEDTKNAIGVANLGNSDDVKVGEMSVAIGNAMGYGQSVTVGYISAKDREVEVSDNYSYKKMILLQTDAAINPGNSGGALLNAEGEVIGINTIKYSSYEVEGMGYAIPISRAIPIINDLMNREVLKPEEQGFLGVEPTDVTEQISEMLNMPMGVFISRVLDDGAAQKAGLMQGDIITSVNDKEITSSVQLREYVSSIRAGSEIEITYMRSIGGTYKEQTVKVVLGARPVE